MAIFGIRWLLIYRKYIGSCYAKSAAQHSQSTVRSSNRHCPNINPPKLISLIVSEIVHCSFGDIEGPVSNVDTKYIDAFLGSLAIGICHIPACTAASWVPVRDSRNGADVGEDFQTAKGCIAASDEAIHTIRAGNGVQAGTWIVKDWIPAETSGECNPRKGNKGGEELHDYVQRGFSSRGSGGWNSILSFSGLCKLL